MKKQISTWLAGLGLAGALFSEAFAEQTRLQIDFNAGGIEDTALLFEKDDFESVQKTLPPFVPLSGYQPLVFVEADGTNYSSFVVSENSEGIVEADLKARRFPGLDFYVSNAQLDFTPLFGRGFNGLNSNLVYTGFVELFSPADVSDSTRSFVISNSNGSVDLPSFFVSGNSLDLGTDLTADLGRVYISRAEVSGRVPRISGMSGSGSNYVLNIEGQVGTEGNVRVYGGDTPQEVYDAVINAEIESEVGAGGVGYLPKGDYASFREGLGVGKISIYDAGLKRFFAVRAEQPGKKSAGSLENKVSDIDLIELR